MLRHSQRMTENDIKKKYVYIIIKKKPMTTQSLKRLLEFTFTFVGSFVQDGLGRHNFAIPSGKRQEHRIQDQ